MKKLDVPYQKQEAWYFCGPTSLSLVVRFLGLEYTPAQLAIILQTNEIVGTSCAAMASTAREIGLWVHESLHADADVLRAMIDSGVAPIIYVFEDVADDHGYGALDHFHFYVVTGYDEHGFFIHDTDPGGDGNAEHQHVLEAELVSRWRAEPDIEGKWVLGIASQAIDQSWLHPRFTGTPITVQQ